MEGLSPGLKKLEREDNIEGIKIRRKSPTITHLLFVDDCYIFTETKIKYVKNVKNYLEMFSKTSRQTINYEKSELMFSKYIPNLIRNLLIKELGIQHASKSGKYLGLPSNLGNNKTTLFSYIENKTNKKIQRWKENFLNQARKEILLKSVITTLPSFAMSCFLIPKKTCNNIDKKQRRFWWGQKEKGKKINWVKCDTLRKNKNDGGLGFRDLHSYNKALLTKQAWRIIKNLDNLWTKFLKEL